MICYTGFMSLKKLDAETLRAHKGISFVGVTTTFFCYDGQGRLFMGKRSQNARDERGAWEIGGGGLKHGVTPYENIKREIKEEYGGDALQVDFLGYRNVLRKLDDGTLTHWIVLDFAVKVDPKQMKNNEPDNIDEVGWFTKDNLPKPLHSQQEPYFAQYAEKLEPYLNTDKNI